MALFNRILIANRGEIACRVIATAQRLGIHTIAVYSDADAGARHVRLADEAWRLGAAEAAKSYLDGTRIIAVAQESGAEAIHPGYGFLAENAGFARACAKAGMVFIGPSPEAMEAMGEKDRAKTAMIEAGVPVVPGYHGADQADKVLAGAAAGLGYPVLIKAVSGGGGRGIRRVGRPEDFTAALEAARREAAAAFGDERMLVEKYIPRPRHIEFQVFGDSAGTVVHLFERDCSIQRRHQKVVEEAPAPGMTEGLRRKMGEAAITAARAIGYQGAGTVEFIVDGGTGLNDETPFYFMEMNTRLQVEHPVTEAVTGLDLVDWQIRVAAGQPLPLAQKDIALHGHAIEVRLYAEDPGRGFLPSAGRLDVLRLPAGGDGIRCDTGVDEGDAVSPHYDAMIAKLIAHGGGRPEALDRLTAALARSRVLGLASNLDFLRRLLASDGFAGGAFDTHFLDEEGAPLATPPAADAEGLLLGALAILSRRAVRARRAAGLGTDATSPWHRVDGWRLNGAGHDELRLVADDTEHALVVHYHDGAYRIDLDGQAYDVAGQWIGENRLAAVIDGRRFEAVAAFAGNDVWIGGASGTWHFSRHDPRHEAVEDEDGEALVVAPMPGKVIRLLVADGQKVSRGEALLVLEAMKMEHTISATIDGEIAELAIEEGQQVEEGVPLMHLFQPGE